MCVIRTVIMILTVHGSAHGDVPTHRDLKQRGVIITVLTWVNFTGANKIRCIAMIIISYAPFINGKNINKETMRRVCLLIDIS